MTLRVKSNASFEPDEREDLPVPDEWNLLTRRIIGCAMEVHLTLGPGLLEPLYEDALVYELAQAGVAVRRQVEIVVPYKTISLAGQRLDLVVENLVIIEIKAVSTVADVHLAQLVSYLRAAALPLGLLMNFHSQRLKDGIFRRLNERAIPNRHHRPGTEPRSVIRPVLYSPSVSLSFPLRSKEPPWH